MPQLRVLLDGHAAVDAAEARARLTGLRAAVWADAQDFEALIDRLDPQSMRASTAAMDRAIARAAELEGSHERP